MHSETVRAPESPDTESKDRVKSRQGDDVLWFQCPPDSALRND
ncbi:hypothetical protein RvY_14566 [Ramazzottius varieornatus]|uniref:Uncharacterized protein n=1 Tax=Ramazzottius varieornatus TaxID=947166 RepID=A0A1D1VWU8_RAMVA|nr:hypothetical protein RvY_14566 [Ramazzottius varieornatus]